MRITKLQSPALKKLLAINVVPKGIPASDTGGSNGNPQGTTIDAIRRTLDTPTATDQGQPTATGQPYGLAVPTPKRAVLSIQPRNGTGSDSPDGLHDLIRRSRTLDAFAFARLPGSEQRAVLLALGTLPLDLDAAKAKRAALVAERARTAENLQQCEITLATLGAPASDVPQAEISPTSLVNELLAAQAQQLANAGLRKQLSELREKAASTQKELARLDRQIRELQGQRDKLHQDYDLMVAMGKEQATRVETLADPDVPALQEQLASLETRNGIIRNAQRYRSLQEQAQAARAKIEQITAALAAIDATMAEAFRATTFPFTIPGLALTDDGVALHGNPLAECSLPDQLRVSLPVEMHQHPTLRVIRLPHHLLTRQTLTVIEQLATDPAYEIWTETVDPSTPIALEIEDATPPPAPEAEPSAPAKSPATATASAAPATVAQASAATTPTTAVQPSPPAAPPATGTPQPTLPGTLPPTRRLEPPRPPVPTPTYATRSGSKAKPA